MTPPNTTSTPLPHHDPHSNTQLQHRQHHHHHINSFPDEDGLPMAFNTLHYQWIVVIKENLELLFQNHPHVFVAADLLWYPNPNDDRERTAPDVMVVFGRPKGPRGSYKMWLEDHIPAHVVFEILSPGNTKAELDHKLDFYQRHGVEEYYLFEPEPERQALEIRLRQEGRLNALTPQQTIGFVSPRLGIRFQPDLKPMRILRPDGEPFVSFLELHQRVQAERQRAEAERQRAEAEHQRAENALKQLQEQAQLIEQLRSQLAAQRLSDPSDPA
ncbi:protein of unknown function DUF820 [Isosphaera pallida ATCC 43644]|uniref:Putative restriction endonuclease domain-containing protein n=1 Tax=Isosphaera pallida (strain ATCC 43644 / DSM 9630 / IS1B) TaxID=575540 RepID=E8QWP0_ISOPI|nr:Uma2 family endonuclease [Isosphaera pallida]ADV62940.1 protein of unknown function DUF820 [Isosphaera pallida ATCC 43644]